VRNVSVFDGFLCVIGGVNIAVGLITYTTGPFIFPGGDLVMGTILATLLSIPIGVMYTLYGIAMPRSGGDYVLVSRVIHPVLGFVENFSLMLWSLFFAAFAVNFAVTLALAPSLLIVGTVTSNQYLVNLSALLSQPQYVLVIGLVLVVIFTLVLLRGIRPTFTLINLFVIVSLIGLALVIGVMATSTRSTFITGFSRFANYDNITATAHAAGYSPVGPNMLLATLGLTPFVFFTTGFANTTTYFAGEIKSVKKNLFYSCFVVTILSGLIMTIIAALTVNTFGYDFLGSISYLQGTGSSAYPFTLSPYLNLFVSMLTVNPTLLWLLAIGYIAAQFAPILPVLMAVSRCMFAWSFDGILPTKFASVSDRLHTPVFTIIVMNILWAITFVIYTYASSYFVALVSGAGLAEMISLIIIAITAIIFPLRHKLYDNTAIKKISIAGIPVISIAGVLSLFFFLLITYFFVTNPLYGANTLSVYEAIIIGLLIPLAIYGAAHYYRKSKGLDLALTFKQLPPE